MAQLGGSRARSAHKQETLSLVVVLVAIAGGIAEILLDRGVSYTLVSAGLLGFAVIGPSFVVITASWDGLVERRVSGRLVLWLWAGAVVTIWIGVFAVDRTGTDGLSILLLGSLGALTFLGVVVARRRPPTGYQFSWIGAGLAAIPGIWVGLYMVVPDSAPNISWGIIGALAYALYAFTASSVNLEAVVLPLGDGQDNNSSRRV